MMSGLYLQFLLFCVGTDSYSKPIYDQKSVGDPQISMYVFAIANIYLQMVLNEKQEWNSSSK